MSKSYRLHVENFLTISEMDIDIDGKPTGFVGENAVGKTNVLKAVQSILSGKHDTRLIKKGEKRSEIRLEELDGDDVIASVSRIQTLRQNRLTGKIPSQVPPKKWLTRLMDEVAINPIRLISDDPVKYLKQHLNVKVEDHEIQTFDIEDGKFAFDTDANSFVECERAASEVATQRSALYKVMRHAKEVVEELRIDIPPLPDQDTIPRKDDIEDQRADVLANIKMAEKNISHKNELKSEINAIELDRDKKKSEIIDIEKDIIHLDNRFSEIDNNYNSFISEQRIKFQNETREDSERIKKQIEELERQLEDNYLNKKSTLNKTLDRAKDSRDKAIAENERLLHEKKTKIESNTDYIESNTKRIDILLAKLSEAPDSDIESLKSKNNTLLSKLKEIDLNDDLKRRYERIDQKEKHYFNLKAEYENLDEIFKYYAYILPRDLIERANLPIKDLAFKDGELYVGETVIDNLSTAERYLIAIKLSIALAKQKNHICICLDGCEVMDENHRKEFLKIIEESDIKILYTRHGKPENDYEVEVKRDV